VANTLKLYRNGAVGFIDWLGILPTDRSQSGDECLWMLSECVSKNASALRAIQSLVEIFDHDGSVLWQAR
jgi:hypothetical protein